MIITDAKALEEEIRRLGFTVNLIWSAGSYFQMLFSLMQRNEKPLGYAGKGKVQIRKRKTQADINREVKNWAENSILPKSKKAIKEEKWIRSYTIGDAYWVDEDFTCALLTQKRLIVVQSGSGYNVQSRRIVNVNHIYSVEEHNGIISPGLRVSWEENRRVELAFAKPAERDIFRSNLEAARKGIYVSPDISASNQNEARERHIPGDIRETVWERDGGRCVLCGSTSDLEFDHIIPFSRGGAHSIANLRVLCLNCNRARSSRIGD